MNADAGNHVAVVLAAGGSRRLGQPKQLLRRDGETLVHRAVRLALATGPTRVLLVCGAHAGEVGDAVGDLPVTLLRNHDWEEGLASSLRLLAGCLQDGERACLLLGCDQPALELDHLQALLLAAGSAASGCAATLHGASPGSPAVVSAAMLANANDLQGDRGLRTALEALPPTTLAVLRADELRLDIDTQAQKKQAVSDGLLDP